MSAKLLSITMLLLLSALTEAQQSVPCPGPGPLSEAQLTKLVKSVPAMRMRQLVASCGIDFEPAGEAIGRLRSAGMPETVLDAVRVATGPAERKRQAEQALWESIKDSQDPTAFEDYLRRYPEGQFVSPARQKHGDLKIAGMRAEMERTLAAGQWDAAEGRIRDLLGAVPENDEIGGWQRQIADGREKFRLEQEANTVAPGTKAVNPKDGLTYVWIPPGTFQMGCSPGDSECNDNEKPTHQVTITRGYWLGQTPVTQGAYQRVTGRNPSHFKGPNLPVEQVDWKEAQAYCVAIRGRLPTEAEWEYAARAGSTGVRYGNLDEIAWHLGDGGGGTHEVGQKRANAFGLFDVLGNVWQWTADWFGDYRPGAQSDPSGAVSGQYTALRGGSWDSYTRGVRVSDRVRVGPGGRDAGIGLRCVGDLLEPAALKPAAPSPMPAAPVIPPPTIAAGAKKVNPKDGLTYVWIPPGTFMMGCSPGDTECDDEEKPAHRVTITKGFWLGRTPVTQQAYQRVTGRNPSYFKGANLPVETVNWDEAEAYCGAIGGRLPTEAEWEYAARAGSTSARYGNLDGIAWYEGNSGSETHEVGQKLANAFGLYDMLGNVWQWVADWYGPYQSGAQSDPSAVGSGQSRALRGGSWYGSPRAVRVSVRDSGELGGHANDFGLRCAGE